MKEGLVFSPSSFSHFVKSKPPPNNLLKDLPASHIVEELDLKSDNLKAVFCLLCWKRGWFHCLSAHKIWTEVLKEQLAVKYFLN